MDRIPTDVSVETIRPVWPKIWKLRTPIALSAEEWEDWTNNAKSAFPVRYWLRDVTNWIEWLPRRADRIWWQLRHRTTDRFHVVKLDIEPGYYDCDERILQSVFHLFNEFMEQQEDGHVDWESDYHSEEWSEMNEIWEWWKQREGREERFDEENPHPELPEKWGFLSVCNSRYEDEAVMKQWKEVSELYRHQEATWDQEDEDMLIRIMKIRRRLWD